VLAEAVAEPSSLRAGTWGREVARALAAEEVVGMMA